MYINILTFPLVEGSSRTNVPICEINLVMNFAMYSQEFLTMFAASRKNFKIYVCSEPASVRCSTDNLVLCQECDWDAHDTCSISASHERSPLEDFSGCPSPLELTSIWGFDICGEKKALQPPAPPLPSTMSPQVNHMVLSSWSSLDMLLSVDPLAYKSESAANTTLQELVVPSDNTLLYQHDPCADVYQQENGRKRK
ncbi:hypothetical protein NE237_021193 [Protea cynaroides]|uniref:Uncharacterized protein n=1 Tax=Protea cynaroides TaxID=273540 RepID=A0A9Q0HAP4_9MAGN|nr:hypothetical protein NE237_021193 [Protea cynaroides]